MKGPKAVAKAFRSQIGMFIICGHIRIPNSRRHCGLYCAASRLLYDRPGHAVEIPVKGDDAATDLMFKAGYIKEGFTVWEVKIHKKFVAGSGSLVGFCSVTRKCTWMDEVSPLLTLSRFNVLVDVAGVRYGEKNLSPAQHPTDRPETKGSSHSRSTRESVSVTGLRC